MRRQVGQPKIQFAHYDERKERREQRREGDFSGLFQLCAAPKESSSPKLANCKGLRQTLPGGSHCRTDSEKVQVDIKNDNFHSNVFHLSFSDPFVNSVPQAHHLLNLLAPITYGYTHTFGCIECSQW